MLRAVIYYRVSTKEQTKNLSRAVQEKACRDYCERGEYELAAIFVDEGESAKTIDRPRFQELLAFCTKIDGTTVRLLSYEIPTAQPCATYFQFPIRMKGAQ